MIEVYKQNTDIQIQDYRKESKRKKGTEKCRHLSIFRSKRFIVF